MEFTLFYLLTYFKIFCCSLLSLVFAAKSCLLTLLPRSIMRNDIKGNVVLITGGALGLGKSLAKTLASNGAKIIIWDINSQECEKTALEIRKEGRECFFSVVDVTDYEAVQDAAKTLKNEHGMVDILVNNAGVIGERDILIDSPNLISKIFAVNILSHFWTVKAFLPDMKMAKKGHIVTISSVSGILGMPKSLAYTSSKAASSAFADTLRVELDLEGYENIETTNVCPYYIDTQMSKGVSTRLGPNLSLDYATNEIVDAILMKTRRIVLPPSIRIMTSLKGLTHHKAMTLLSKATVGLDPMKTAVWVRESIRKSQ